MPTERLSMRGVGAWMEAPGISALKEGVQNEAVSIDGANMALHLAVDRDHDRAAMPLVAELRGSPTDLVGAGPAECLRRASHGLMADDDSARRQQVLDHPQAERKAEIEPDGLLNDFGREPVASINGFRCRHHRAQIADVRRHFVILTVPAKGQVLSASLEKGRALRRHD